MRLRVLIMISTMNSSNAFFIIIFIVSTKFSDSTIYENDYHEAIMIFCVQGRNKRTPALYAKLVFCSQSENREKTVIF